MKKNNKDKDNVISFPRRYIIFSDLVPRLKSYSASHSTVSSIFDKESSSDSKSMVMGINRRQHPEAQAEPVRPHRCRFLFQILTGAGCPL